MTRNCEEKKQETEHAVKMVLNYIGEDPEREGLLKTPHRFTKAMAYLTKGYEEDPEKVINNAVFHEEVDEMVIVKDIEFYSLCEHHLLPFFGKAHVAYIPNGKIIGLSKIARLVEIYARRLQVQERLTNQVAETLEKCLAPQGVAVAMQAQHLCMQMRGVEKRQSTMITSAMTGCFKNELATRSEFMDFVKNSF
ncbi:MAG: GTP cyclohydrolase I FolE [Deltaproteobacteria bacterium]|nr:GTP cyclohydrolase I FolE [Deltaproteobacteria bacterium]